MAQFKDFECIVTNGSTTVRAIWEVFIGSISGGPYVDGEALSWAGTGVGVLVSVDTGAGSMRLYRTAGEEPEALDTITGGSSSATCDITSIVTANQYGNAVNPPRFDDSPTQGAIQAADGFVANAALVAAVFGVVGGSIARDSFALVSNWTGATLVDVPGFIVRDFTPNWDLPLVNQGDGRAASIIAEAMRRLDVVDVFSAWKDVDNDAVAGWQGNWDDKGGAGDYEVRWRSERGRVVLSGSAERTPNFAPSVFNRTSYQHVSRNAALAAGNDQHIEWDNRIGYEDDAIVEANVTTPVDQTPGVWSKGRFRLGVNGLYVFKAHVHQCLVDSNETPPTDLVQFNFRDVTTGSPVVLAPPSTQAYSSIGIGLIDQHNITAYFEVTGAPSTKPLIDLYLNELVADEFLSIRDGNESWMSVQYFNPFAAAEADELLFTLPVGDRPRHNVVIPVQDGNFQERVEIGTDGTVYYKGYGDGSGVDLSHVTFTVA
jgi:hypothetical protein